MPSDSLADPQGPPAYIQTIPSEPFLSPTEPSLPTTTLDTSYLLMDRVVNPSLSSQINHGNSTLLQTILKKKKTSSSDEPIPLTIDDLNYYKV